MEAKGGCIDEKNRVFDMSTSTKICQISRFYRKPTNFTLISRFQ